MLQIIWIGILLAKAIEKLSKNLDQKEMQTYAKMINFSPLLVLTLENKLWYGSVYARYGPSHARANIRGIDTRPIAPEFLMTPVHTIWAIPYDMGHIPIGRLT